MPKKILQKDDGVLRKKSERVKISDIKSAKIQRVIKEMKEALDSQDDGVAIAAPQIGYSLRIFLISEKIFGIDGKEKKDSSKRPLVYINPKLTKLSSKKEWMEEGCLSVRWFYGKVHRHKNATVEAYDEKGKKFTRGAGGLLAQAFQHEINHLDGTLFIDHAKDIIDQPPE